MIGNIPFGNYPVHDPAYKNSPVTRTIHDYFLAKSLDKLRPGGVMALITSRYTMDKQDSTIRRYLSDRADLVGAIRLPNTAFKANAGTEVTTDILFLQKRVPGSAARCGAWRDLATIDTPDGAVSVNEYFARHPEMMLGAMRLEGTMYRDREPTLTGELTPELLQQAIASLPENICAARNTLPDRARPPPDNRPRRYRQRRCEGRRLRDPRRSAGDPPGQCIRDRESAGLRGLAHPRHAGGAGRHPRRLPHAARRCARERIAEARKLLNDIYDSFVCRYGPLSSRENIKAFAGDPDQPLLLSLENYDPETKRATKTAIFERRTLERYKPVAHVETAAEALAVSLNETGEIDWPRMEAVTGRPRSRFAARAGQPRLVQPGGRPVGNRRPLPERRRAPQAGDSHGGGGTRSCVTRATSTRSKPSSLPIWSRATSRPASARRGFRQATYGNSSARCSTHRPPTSASGTPRPSRPGRSRSTAARNTTSPTRRRTARRAFAPPSWSSRRSTAACRRPMTSTRTERGSSTSRKRVAAREKQQQLKDRFREWIWEDGPRATRLAREYNDRFNNLRLRSFDGAHLLCRA